MERAVERNQSASIQDIFSRGGAMGDLMRSVNWSATPLGPAEEWPQSLRTAVSICLHSRFPILIWWGDELVMLYNDAYRSIIAAKHPRAMGAPGRVVFPEIWDVIGPMLTSVLHDGAATWSDDQLLLLDRNGYLEECYFTFSYSPIYGEGGGVDGVFTAVTETTARVLGERRLRALRELTANTSEARTAAEACARATQALAESRADLPFARIYLPDPRDPLANALGGPLHLAGSSPDAHEAAAADGAVGEVELARVAQVARTGEAALMEEAPAPLAERSAAGFVASADAGADASAQPTNSTRSAWLLPIRQQEQQPTIGVLVAGLNPQRPLDEDYRAFLGLVAGQIATAIAAASAHEQERQRAEQLAELDRAKTTFFSNVSHEFRTPLTLILGPLADLLHDAATPPAIQEQLAVVQRNGQRLLKLVNTLLEFSRIEAGHVEASLTPTDVSAYTAELASVFRSAIERAGLRLEVDCPPLERLDLPESVDVDREMWEKIVFNLLSNAFKFTFTGSISVSVRRGANRSLEMVVRDTGVGIPPDELPHLFERFHRVQGARARTFEGTGIGLALTQELVKLHGGTVRVESAPDAGTTVTVSLPTTARTAPLAHTASTTSAPVALAGGAQAVAPYLEEALHWQPGSLQSAATLAPANAPASAPANAPANAPGQRARVLVADDNADMRDYLRRILAGAYEVETVADGAAALAVARARPPDLALVDVMMPELDGFGLLRELRADPHTRAIPVVLLSARAGEEATIEGLRAGADDYLVKPFSADEALARVATRLEMARLRAEAETARQHLRDLFMQAPACICVTHGPEHRIELINDNFRALYGWRDFTGKTAREAWPELAHQGLFETLDRVYTTGEPFVAREVYARIDRNNDGVLEDGYFSLVYQPARDAHGAVEGILVHAMEVTDQARARQALREGEAAAQRRAGELETILDTIADGVVIYDDAGRLLRWNAALAELLEFGQMPEYAGLAVDTRPEHLHVRDEHDQPIPADQLPFMRAARGELLTGAQAVDLRVTTLSGRVKYINTSAAPLRDETGRTVGAVAVYRDVTERRQSEERLRAILELLPVGVSFVDADGKAVLVNQAVRDIWGEGLHLAESRDDYGAYNAWWSATGEPVAPEEWGLARALDIGETSIGEEFEIETADGARKSILGSNAPLRNAAGAIIGGVSVIMDISDRKRLERRTHDIYEALLAMAEALTRESDATESDQAAAPGPAQMAARSANGPFVAHPGVRRLMALTQRVFGGHYTAMTITEPEHKALTPVAVVGLSHEIEEQWWRSIGHGSLSDYFPPALVERLYAGESLILDMSQQPPIPGQDYFGIQSLLVAPALMRSGHLCLLGVEVRERAVFTPDELDLAQAAVRLAALTLDREQSEWEREDARTRALALTEANRRMDEFLGIASHELRTPLTSVQANVQLIGRRLARLTSIADRPMTAETLRTELAPMGALVERTERQMRRLTRLVSDLLDVTRIRGGQLEFAPELCDLAALAREAVEEQRVTWPGRTITYQAPSAPIRIIGDPDRIGQVVTNYLTNALKYSAPKLKVAVRVRVEDGVARVAVRDSGPGLTPEQQARLFERFYRAPGIEQQSGSGVGLGLGLSICRTIIQRHGGEVGVESAPGDGSVFWFTLPLAPTDTASPTD